MKHKHNEFDVVVVGGGHAGCEAALAAARMGVTTALVTHRFDRIGEMSCNPAIGGLGKGHLVREVDALDGAMGVVADRAGIQFRLLNRRKGPAVQGPRAQCDRSLYRSAMQEIVTQQQNLTVIEDEVVDLLFKDETLNAVDLKTVGRLNCKSVVVTTGTFLRGKIHIGQNSHAAGRMGDAPSIKLAKTFDNLGIQFGRLKTGTPPRLTKDSIAWDKLEEQPGDDTPTLFSFLSASVVAPQISCGITYTNERTHQIIRDNLDQSAMYSGRIEGVGPRYCPSIEDKVERFSDKPSHQIFLEPEGTDSDLIYPNGISTSLPEEIQYDYVRSIVGLEQAEIAQPGYAIEYDYVDPRSLDRRLALTSKNGLFLAGQINGTTGYEEAAAQGLVAGLNAALLVKDLEPFILDRADGYIGVLIDDLIIKGVTEPYRMFTSRAEYRLVMRADNADQRLTEKGRAIGCVGEARWRAFCDKQSDLARGKVIASAIKVTPQEAKSVGISVNSDGVRRSMLDLLAYKDVTLKKLSETWTELKAIEPRIQKQLENDALYAGYVTRQESQIAELRRSESVRLAEHTDYSTIPGLSAEFASKLNRVQPETLGQASRIEGCTPAALTVLLAEAKRREKKIA